MSKKALLFLVIIGLTLVLFTKFPLKNNQLRTPPDNKNRVYEIDLKSFTVTLPAEWKYIEKQGFDSFVGDFVGDGTTLSFDYGWYSDTLENRNEPEYQILNETIGGKKAKIVIPHADKGLTGINFSDLLPEESANNSPGVKFNNKTGLTVYGNDLNEKQKQKALQIFRSIRFK